ncbi:hypothetical protein ACFL5V_02245 [Fibrobacterota bacterium]
MHDDVDNEFIHSIFKSTEISRKPITGIVQGYHILPYILVGPNTAKDSGSVKLKGEITVSPKLVFSPHPNNEKFEEIFEEPEPFMDKSIVSRTFSFKIAPQENKNIKGGNLTIEIFEACDKEILKNVLEELERQEKINTGVIWCPHPRFYPISLEKFIHSILDREFS